MPYFVNGDNYVLCALQLEEAEQSAWAEILAVDFHVAVLDVPKLCVKLGMYDGLLGAPPQDATLTARLAKWNAVYMEPSGALLAALEKFVALCKKAGKTPGVLLADAAAGPAYSKLGFKFLGAGSDMSTRVRPSQEERPRLARTPRAVRSGAAAAAAATSAPWRQLRLPVLPLSRLPASPCRAGCSTRPTSRCR